MAYTVLHSADWHLGQQLKNKERYEEFERVLEELLQHIVEQEVDLLVLAGDVFDVSSPSNKAQKLYYNFFYQLNQRRPSCQALVVAGNHDSAPFLDVPKEFFREKGIYVLGTLPETVEEQVFVLRNAQGQAQICLAAVPYLKDRDVRKALAGQSADERTAMLKEGIKQHYAQVAQAVKQQEGIENCPCIATGHLFVKHGDRGERQNIIHAGGIDLVDTKVFDPIFDYVALGHLHRAQEIEKGRIYYSGSLLAMDFHEWNYEHSVRLLRFEGKKLVENRALSMRSPRLLRHYKGSLDYIKEKLAKLPDEPTDTIWLKLEVQVEDMQSYLWQDLQEMLRNELKKDAEILECIQRNSKVQDLQEEEEEQGLSLEQLKEEDVFERLVRDYGATYSEEQQKALQKQFRLLLQTIQEEKNSK